MVLGLLRNTHLRKFWVQQTVKIVLKAKIFTKVLATKIDYLVKVERTIVKTANFLAMPALNKSKYFGETTV
jgi:hypothetical protein